MAIDDPVYRDQWVTVTPNMIVINGTMYAPSYVASVDVRERRTTWPFILVGILLIGAGLKSVACAVVVDIAFGGFGATLTSLLLIVGGIVVARWGPFMTRAKYMVVLGVGGAQAEVIWSYDAAWSARVARAIGSVIGVWPAGYPPAASAPRY